MRVEFGGFQINNENELNGIAFQGVGSGTTIEYIRVHRSKDDGVEFFGGTAPQPADAAVDMLPASGSPALSGFVSPGDDFFDDVSFRGAFGEDDWTAGWTAFPAN